MLKNYLGAASSNLIKHKSYAFTTLSGLVLGMTSCMLILLYVLDELRFDKWIPEAESLYRYETTFFDQQGNVSLFRKSALRASGDLKEFFPEIAASTRVIDHQAVVSGNAREYFETVWFVDASFFDVFRLPLLQGDSVTALTDKSSIVISQQMANKYFADGLALGQLLTLDGSRDFTVAGVFTDIPQESHISPEFLLLYDESDPQYNFGYSESWSSMEGYTYVRLQPNADADAINRRLPAFRESLTPDFVVPAGRTFADVIQPKLINVLDIHLDEGGVGNIKAPGSQQLLISLMLVAVLVLVIASFNFVNLSTVRSLGRVREVAMRKAIGAAREQLVFQFLCESVLMSLLAFAASLSLVELLLPWYNGVLSLDVEMDYFSKTMAMLGIGAVVLGAFSGLYPAWRFSSWQPASTLRSGSCGATRGGSWVQSLLVIAQFTISSTLVITTLMVLMQQSFIAGTDAGFSAEHKVIVRNMDQRFARDKRDLIATEFSKIKGVTGIAFSSATPSDSVGAAFSRQVSAPGYREELFSLYPKAVSAGFLEVYDIPLVAGRGFSDALTTDTFYWPAPNATEPSYSAAILNTSAVTAAGFASAQDAIGKTLRMQNMQMQIVGVVPDVHFQSLRDAITPNMYIDSPEGFATLTLAYAPNVDERQLLAELNSVWKTLVPGIPPTFEFLEDNISAQYARDNVQLLLIAIATGLAVVIACMGLFALASYSTRQRTREIGIRKIHGALGSDILAMLLMQFSKPIVLANVMAWPCALYAVTQYLQQFQYRIEPQLSVFVLATVATLFIAWAAIIVHVVKVASTAPATVLRHE